jgi:hypothetical protein
MAKTTHSPGLYTTEDDEGIRSGVPMVASYPSSDSDVDSSAGLTDDEAGDAFDCFADVTASDH